MKLSFKVDNMTEYLRMTQKLGALYQASELRPILLSGANVIKNGVLLFAPIDTGGLAKSLVAKLHQREDMAVAYMAVDFDKITKVDKKGKKVRYPYIVEYGSKAHAITSPRGHVMASASQVFGSKVDHPGFSGLGYFKRGFEFSRNDARRKINAGLVGKIRGMADAVSE